MDRDQAREYIRGQLENYLQQRGINTRKPFCCLNPAHSDRNPSMSYDRKRNKAHCFSCGADYDTLDLIGIDHNLTTPADIFSKAHDLYRIDIENNSRPAARADFDKGQNPAKSVQDTQEAQEARKGADSQQVENYLQQARQKVAQTDYYQRRGISPEIIDRYGLGYDPNFKTREGEQFKTWQAAIIPTGPNNYTARNTDPTATKENRIRKRGSSLLFNAAALQSGGPVFVVEGELDALSLAEVDAAAVALGSTANADQFIRTVKNQAPAGPLVLSLDNDVDGQQTTDKLQKELSALGIPFLQANVSGEHKDPNDALTADRATFALAVMEAQDAATAQETAEQEAERAAYLQTAAAAHIDAFVNGIADSVNTPAIPTGFDTLDRVFDGGLYEGLYIIGAISSLGKTSFLLQVADQIAQQGQDVIIFSLEMARAELMAKSISRLTLKLSGDPRNAKTARGITTGKRYANYTQTERDLIKDAITAYSEYAGTLYITEGMGDVGAAYIRDAVGKHYFFTGKKPVVIVDYLQLLAPHDPRSTDKQNMDKAVLELKRISRDYKIPVAAISSFNRQGYKEAVTMESFKESGAIEYSSDVLIGLQAKGAGKKDFDVNAAKRKDPREIELVILKNRNGRTGDTIAYEYYPLFNYFKEN